MVLLDNLFSRKPAGKSASTAELGLAQSDAGPSNPPMQDEHSLERKSQRLERRELLYAVVRESMARIGILSSSYKYKVLSLDSRGSEYLIMMDLPQEMAQQIGQLTEIEEVIGQKARMRHKIEVSAVYWRINQPGKSGVLRKPRPAADSVAAQARETEVMAIPRAPVLPGASNKRFEPIRTDEVNAFRQALANGSKKAFDPDPKKQNGKASTDFAPTEFRPTEFEQTQLQEDEITPNIPLSRTQYGDLI